MLIFYISNVFGNFKKNVKIFKKNFEMESYFDIGFIVFRVLGIIENLIEVKS